MCDGLCDRVVSINGLQVIGENIHIAWTGEDGVGRVSIVDSETREEITTHSGFGRFLDSVPLHSDTDTDTAYISTYEGVFEVGTESVSVVFDADVPHAIRDVSESELVLQNKSTDDCLLLPESGEAHELGFQATSVEHVGDVLYYVDDDSMTVIRHDCGTGDESPVLDIEQEDKRYHIIAATESTGVLHTYYDAPLIFFDLETGDVQATPDVDGHTRIGRVTDTSVTVWDDLSNSYKRFSYSGGLLSEDTLSIPDDRQLLADPLRPHNLNGEWVYFAESDEERDSRVETTTGEVLLSTTGSEVENAAEKVYSSETFETRAFSKPQADTALLVVYSHKDLESTDDHITGLHLDRLSDVVDLHYTYNLLVDEDIDQESYARQYYEFVSDVAETLREEYDDIALYGQSRGGSDVLRYACSEADYTEFDWYLSSSPATEYTCFACDSQLNEPEHTLDSPESGLVSHGEYDYTCPLTEQTLEFYDELEALGAQVNIEEREHIPGVPTVTTIRELLERGEEDF